MSGREPIYKIAREEVSAWTRSGRLSEGLVMAILFTFIHRYTTGRTFEESFGEKESELDYQI